MATGLEKVFIPVPKKGNAKKCPNYHTIALISHDEITADGDCSHEIKRRLLFGRKIMTNLDSIFKSRDVTLSEVF